MFIVDSYRFASAQEEFIILVKTDNAGTSASDQFTIPTSVGTYFLDRDWETYMSQL